jgi:hypothetical protein
MSDEKPNFYEVVRLFRGSGSQFAMRVLYAAMHWDDARLEDAERAGDLPGRPGEIKPTAATIQ